jgi:APA family basic amino acid/polyamine antiporter
MDYRRLSSARPRLKRSLGFWTVTLIGIGIIVGAGIYALIGEGIAVAGPNVWLSFLAAAVVAMLTGLSYAELSSLFPKAGAEFSYFKNAFSQHWAFLAGWLIMVAGFVSVSTVALGFGGYFSRLTGFPVLESAVAIIVLSTFVVWLGVKQSAWLGAFFTLIETAGLLFIIFIGLPVMGSQPVLDFSFSIAAVLGAGALVFFAFIGFEDIVRMSEETKNPTRTIPRAVIAAILVSSLLYILVAIAAISLVGADSLAHSSSPLADVANAAAGSQAFWVLSIIALFSTSNTVMLFILAVSRIVYGMAAEKSLPVFLSHLHSKTSSPDRAVLLSGFFSLVCLAIGGIAFVANTTGFLLFIVFIGVNLAVIKLRFEKPGLERPFRTPFSIGKMPLLPLCGILACLLLIAFIPTEVILLGSGVVLAGFLLVWTRKT